MRKSIPFLAIIFIFLAFTNPSKKTYKTDTEKSVVEWKGFKPTGEHYGSIQISDGNLITNNGQLISGNFTFDLTSIKVLDSDSPRLEKHLKSDDFFDVVAHPSAKFAISGSSLENGKTRVKGFLTIKGITKEISFLAKVSHNELGQFVLESETFKINRATYNVKYKSKTFYADLKDKFIDDEFEMKVKVISSPN